MSNRRKTTNQDGGKPITEAIGLRAGIGAFPPSRRLALIRPSVTGDLLIAIRISSTMDTKHITFNQAKQGMVPDLRNVAEKIRKRAKLLDEPDRTLVRMYLENANSFRQIAQLLGVSEVTVARRVKKIAARLSTAEVDTVLKTDPGNNSRQRKIARDYFLRGLTVKAIARKYNMSYYRTRQFLERIRTKTNRREYKTKVRFY